VSADDGRDALGLLFRKLERLTVAAVNDRHGGIPLQRQLVEPLHLLLAQDVGEGVARGLSLLATTTRAAGAALATAAGSARSTRSARSARSTRAAGTAQLFDFSDLLCRQSQFLLHGGHADDEHRAAWAASAHAARTARLATRTAGAALLRQGRGRTKNAHGDDRHDHQRLDSFHSFSLARSLESCCYSSRRS
jgi:hypothetical protein